MTGTAASTYAARRRVFSDIQRHLPRLRRAAHGTVLELGVRGGNSTAALLAGVEERGGTVWSVDVDPACAEVFAGHPQWRFVHADSRDVAAIDATGLPPVLDVLFVDTLHEYEQVKSELRLWAPRVRPGGRILLHDAEVAPDMWRGVLEYCREHDLPYRLVRGSNGLGILYPSARPLLRSALVVARPLDTAAAAARGIARRVGPLRRVAARMRT